MVADIERKQAWSSTDRCKYCPIYQTVFLHQLSAVVIKASPSVWQRRPQLTNSSVIDSWEEPDCLPVNSLVMALFCRRAEQMRSSQGGRNSWWLARSSAMVLGEPGEDLCSPSPSWQPSSMESTSRKRDCWGGLTLRRGRRTHLRRERERSLIMFSSVWLCYIITLIE